MIFHDLADAFDTLIGRAVLTVGGYAALGAAVFIGAVILFAGMVTGLWTGQPADEHATDETTEYGEAA